MATNIVKWWKTRFLNGYKQFTVLMPGDSASESGRDTEELLSCHSAPLSPPPLTPVQAPMPTAPPDLCCCGNQPEQTRRELKFEEFECDVAVQGNDETQETVDGVAQEGNKCRQCGPPRQEFSFTLYDLDGHGKITKEDIAGLVTTIYDTLGATIQVPHSGSKTIRVRLTVAPENKSCAVTPSTTPHKNCQSKTINLNSEPLQKLSCNKESLYRNLSPAKLASDVEQLYSQLNLSSPSKAHKESLYANVSFKSADSVPFNNNNSTAPCKVDKADAADLPKARFFHNETGHTIAANNVNTPHIAKKISRHESLRRDRLPNPKVSSLVTGSASTPSTPLRAASTPKASYGIHSPRSAGRKATSHNSSPNRPKRRATFTAPAPPPNPPENINRERAYSGTLQRQELLHIIQANMEKNLLALHHNSTHHRKRGDEVPSAGGVHSHRQTHSSPKGGQPLSSKRVTKRPAQQPRKTTKTTVDPTNNVISCSHYYLDLAGMEGANLCGYCDRDHKRNPDRNQHVLRHKTRELDHARAMAQVVEWLQGGQVGSIGSSGQSPAQDAVQEESEEDDDSESPRTHRHIHEHVHHHYHHYTDNAMVV